MPIPTTQFDVTRYLGDEEAIANYLDDCLEEGGSRLFLAAIGDVARARGMSEIASTTGMTRASLYKSLGEEGNPAFTTMERVLDSLGLRIAVVSKASATQTKAATKVVKGGSIKKRVINSIMSHAKKSAARRFEGVEKVRVKVAMVKEAPKPEKKEETNLLVHSYKRIQHGGLARSSMTGEFVPVAAAHRTTIKENASRKKK